MADIGRVTVKVRLGSDGKKSVRAMRVLNHVLESLAEDFNYREDVRLAVKALRYLNRHLVICSPLDEVQTEV